VTLAATAAIFILATWTTSGLRQWSVICYYSVQPVDISAVTTDLRFQASGRTRYYAGTMESRHAGFKIG